MGRDQKGSSSRSLRRHPRTVKRVVQSVHEHEATGGGGDSEGQRDRRQEKQKGKHNVGSGCCGGVAGGGNSTVVALAALLMMDTFLLEKEFTISGVKVFGTGGGGIRGWVRGCAACSAVQVIVLGSHGLLLLLLLVSAVLLAPWPL